VHGDSGAVLGGAPHCRLTVTFFRRKPGHLLLPGRVLAGETVVADIGIPERVLDEIAPSCHENGPALWLDRYPWPRPDGHKYSRGHAVIVGGSRLTGAGRLAARAALRVGAGLVTVAADTAALPIYAADAACVMTAPVDDAGAFAELLSDPRKNAALLGPGNGVSPTTRDRVLATLAAGKACVLDADALSVFADEPVRLFAAIAGPCVLTPHEGEFARLFRLGGDKLARVRAAAALSHAVVLLKGADTVVAAPDGRTVINANAPPELATAGAGDVLAGLIVGLMAQGVALFDAACAAAWLHGEAATAVGPGLIGDDLPDNLPPVLRRLKAEAAPE
jgi:NAD(P)H-hydrate epimerase